MILCFAATSNLMFERLVGDRKCKSRPKHLACSSYQGSYISKQSLGHFAGLCSTFHSGNQHNVSAKTPETRLWENQSGG